MSSRRDIWVVGASLLAALIVGFGLGRGTNAVPPSLVSSGETLAPSSPRTSESNRAGPDLLDEVRGLRGDLRSVLEISRNRASADSNSAEGPAELLAALKDLALALRERPVSSSAAGAALDVRAPATAKGYPKLDGAWQATPQELTHAHAFWTLSDLITRYGMPGHIEPKDGALRVHYLNADRDGPDMVFVLYEGLVIGVD
jgi:hypothetical protein